MQNRKSYLQQTKVETIFCELSSRRYQHCPCLLHFHVLAETDSTEACYGVTRSTKRRAVGDREILRIAMWAAQTSYVRQFYRYGKV